jgi:hypothetical protein
MVFEAFDMIEESDSRDGVVTAQCAEVSALFFWDMDVKEVLNGRPVAFKNLTALSTLKVLVSGIAISAFLVHCVANSIKGTYSASLVS